MRIPARLAAVLCSTVTVFAALATSACTGSTGSPNANGSGPASFFTAKAPGSGTASGGSGSGSGSGSALPVTPTPTPTLTVVPSASPSPSPSPSAVAPIGAPSTGGGGTAGLQHVTLFGLGVLAVLAGLASLIYRRRALRR
jgi:hypothetical protein